jgi:hypothetical protein
MATDLHLVKPSTYLSNFATAYRVEDNVADFIAPPFKVNKQSYKYLVYGKDNFRMYDNKVSRREKSKEIITQADEATYTCETYKLAKFIHDDDYSVIDDSIRLDEKSAMDVKDGMILAREKRIYDIAGSASVVTQTVNAAGDWDTAASGTPVADILTGIKTIYESTGKKANRIVMPFTVAIEAIKTDEWKDYFKYTGSNSIWDLLAGLRNIGLDGRIAGAQGLSTYQGAASDPTSEILWSDSVLVYYCEPTPTLQSQSFMYSPFIEKDTVRKIRDEREEGTYIEMKEIIDELLVNASCAYLITNTL